MIIFHFPSPVPSSIFQTPRFHPPLKMNGIEELSIARKNRCTITLVCAFFNIFFPSPAPSPDIPDNLFFPWCFIKHSKHICQRNPLMPDFFSGLGQIFRSRRPQHVLGAFQTCLLHFLVCCKPMQHNQYQIKDEFIFQRSRVEGTRKILNPRIIS